ncbi:DUF6134 family protein [Paracidovorax citrulli]|uniref:DUF6134 family protein n=1 Tax=Paracidovorax citrulli TaxID=80869 RepID=UPI0005FAC759|nr:DUF6134 family protein [Paracidovorax citrulli]QCX09552.1 hypothetical protein APS58_0609 [Paracidovorax citrulli]UEG47472.1 DUF6134 family protein [Paracidovorax citrulli]UMT89271.1 hypothetical protein FRC90_15160 [Paracidovorax citrulli]UMT96011.1 hypothetical protein FRC97_13920 [Paracidovorax citrulli]WIY35977.1 DUF6134 family protein [Paracidovorax citrulli]
MNGPARSRRLRAVALASALGPGLLLAAATAGAHAQGATEQQWSFAVSLDGSPIGEHRFRLGAPEGGSRQLESSARFTVKVLGIAVYRYRHEAREQWRGNCLRRIATDTDDDGDRSTVRQEFPPDGPCTRSFAYWNPAILESRQLLDPQTGKLEPVQISREEDGSITVRGQPRAATRWRITGPRNPIDVWYAADTGEWVGLDSTVRGGRKLSYRLP